MPYVQIEEKEMKRLLTELDTLRERVTELQAESTKRANERRVSDITYAVSEFHLKYDQPVHAVPYVPADDLVRFRMRLIAEEFFEAMESVFPASVTLSLAHEAMSKVIEHEIVTVDLVNLSRELCDIDYVVEGTRLYFGIPRAEVLIEIQRANMDKEPVLGAVVKKPTKPAGWRPPDIEGVLRRFYWDGRDGRVSV